jgi:hypothetical protein
VEKRSTLSSFYYFSLPIKRRYSLGEHKEAIKLAIKDELFGKFRAVNLASRPSSPLSQGSFR